jgi:catalase
MLVREAAARDFVADAYAHAKFIAFTPAAEPLLAKAGVEKDAGFFDLEAGGTAAFVEALGDLRLWEREPKVHA